MCRDKGSRVSHCYLQFVIEGHRDHSFPACFAAMIGRRTPHLLEFLDRFAGTGARGMARTPPALRAIRHGTCSMAKVSMTGSWAG